MKEIWPVVFEFAKIIISTFIGGFAAIQFESRKNKRKEKEEKYSILLNTQAVLITQKNVLHDLSLNYVPIFKGRNYYEIEGLILDPIYVKIDQTELMKIINKNHAQLYFRIIHCENKFNAILTIIKERTESYMRFCDQSNRMPLEQALRTTYAVNLSALTSSFVKHFDDAVRVNEKMINQLTEYIKEEYPKRMVLELSGEFEHF